MVCVFHGSVYANLTVIQDPVDFCAAILDSTCRTLDPVEDSSHQGCALLGMADQTGDHCRVGVDASAIRTTTDET